jgi:hypothetical protein
VVALVVALAAGGSVYALMSGGGDSNGAGGDPTASQTASAPTTAPTGQNPDQGPTAQPSETTEESPVGGVIPTKYLGSWVAVFGTDQGSNTRRLTIQQGQVGDIVLSLTADGPEGLEGDEGDRTYHCVFQARLAAAPTADGPLRISPSTVTVGEPPSSCTPGEASELTILPDGSLRRLTDGSGAELTYNRTD